MRALASQQRRVLDGAHVENPATALPRSASSYIVAFAERLQNPAPCRNPTRVTHRPAGKTPAAEPILVASGTFGMRGNAQLVDCNDLGRSCRKRLPNSRVQEPTLADVETTAGMLNSIDWTTTASMRSSPIICRTPHGAGAHYREHCSRTHEDFVDMRSN